MTTTTADQGLILPQNPDPATVPPDLTALTGGIESRLVKRYVDEADRTARNPTPTGGEISWLANVGRHEWWNSLATVPSWWELRALTARKTSETQTANNVTAFISDTHLVLPMRANAVYALTGWFWWDSGTTADIKFDWTGPAGFAVPAWAIAGVDTAVASNVGNWNGGGSAAAATPLARAGAGIGTFSSGILNGIVTTGGTAGSLQNRWSANALEAVNCRLKIGSWIRLERVG